MTIAFLFLSLWVTCLPIASAAEPDNPFKVDANDPAALQEATRVLSEEVKLAARPRAYLVIDLVANAVIMKARGVELHRLSISKWSAESPEGMAGTFRLMARPSVGRRKIDPSLVADQEPISLADMPAHYHLAFSPSLTLEILPTVDQAPLRWTLLQAKAWWRWLRACFQSLASSQPSQPDPLLLLTLSEDQAQSLAWSLVDGMPLVIRRPTDR